MVCVHTAIGTELHLLDHDPDDGVGHLVDQERLAHRVVRTEDVLGNGRPQEDHSASLRVIERIEKPASGDRNLVAQLAPDRAHSFNTTGDGILTIGQGGTPAGDLAADADQPRDSQPEGLDVVDPGPNRPTRRQALPRHRGLTGPDNGDIGAHAGPSVLERNSQALTKGQEKKQGQRSPGDGRDRQDSSLLLNPGGSHEELEDHETGLTHRPALLVHLHGHNRVEIGSSSGREEASDEADQSQE